MLVWKSYTGKPQYLGRRAYIVDAANLTLLLPKSILRYHFRNSFEQNLPIRERGTVQTLRPNYRSLIYV